MTIYDYVKIIILICFVLSTGYTVLIKGAEYQLRIAVLIVLVSAFLIYVFYLTFLNYVFAKAVFMKKFKDKIKDPFIFESILILCLISLFTLSYNISLLASNDKSIKDTENADIINEDLRKLTILTFKENENKIVSKCLFILFVENFFVQLIVFYFCYIHYYRTSEVIYVIAMVLYFILTIPNFAVGNKNKTREFISSSRCPADIVKTTIVSIIFIIVLSNIS